MSKGIKKLFKGLLTLAVVGALFTSYSFDSQAANVGYANVTPETLNAANALHSYYTSKMSADEINLAELNAKYYADAIMASPDLTTDLDRVYAAAYIVSLHCSEAQYGQDTTKYYKSPVGLFVYNIYTCAGSTRSLGRILDYMGFEWYHVNENQNKHQWCVVVMDGQVGYADGMGGFAGYGEMQSGVTTVDGQVIYFPE